MSTIGFFSFMLIISPIIWEIEFPGIEQIYVNGELVEEHRSPFFVIASAPLYFYYTVILALYTSMAIVVFKYTQYYTKDPPEVYFNRFGAKEAISTYRYSNSLFYLMALLSVFASVFFVIWITVGVIDTLGSRILGELVWILISEAPALMLITISLAIIKHSHTRRDFDFYLTRAYFTLGSPSEDEAEKLKHLILSLNAYNEFLERKLKLKINDIMRIYSIIISADAKLKLEIRESIGKALEKDKMELARKLAELSSLKDEDEFLMRESIFLNLRFKEVLTVTIPAIISIVTFIIALLTQAGIMASQQSTDPGVLNQTSDFLMALTTST